VGQSSQVLTIQFIHPVPHITLRNSFLLIDRDYCEKFTNNKYIIVFWLWNRLMPKAVLNWIRMKKTSEKKRFYYFFVCEIFFFYRQFSACFRSFLCRFYASFTILLIQPLRPAVTRKIFEVRDWRKKGKIVSVVKIYYQKHGLMTMIVLRLLVKSLTYMAIDTFMYAA